MLVSEKQRSGPGLAQRIKLVGMYLRKCQDAAVFGAWILMNVVAGTRFRGDFEERMNNIIMISREEMVSNPLFVDELHTIMLW